MTAGSWMVAIRRRRPPQFGHASTSMAKARCMRVAQRQERGPVCSPAPSGAGARRPEVAGQRQRPEPDCAWIHAERRGLPEKASLKQGPFAPGALPPFIARMTPSDSPTRGRASGRGGTALSSLRCLKYSLILNRVVDASGSRPWWSSTARAWPPLRTGGPALSCDTARRWLRMNPYPETVSLAELAASGR